MRTEPLMPDLDALIRERLDDPKRFLENGIEPLIDAITAVLDLHALRPGGGIGYEPDDGSKYERMGRVCTSCGPPDEYAVRWPCPEVRAIAAALGIEVDGG